MTQQGSACTKAWPRPELAQEPGEQVGAVFITEQDLWDSMAVATGWQNYDMSWLSVSSVFIYHRMNTNVLIYLLSYIY